MACSPHTDRRPSLLHRPSNHLSSLPSPISHPKNLLLESLLDFRKPQPNFKIRNLNFKIRNLNFKISKFAPWLRFTLSHIFPFYDDTDYTEDEYLARISYQIGVEIERRTGESPWHPGYPEDLQLLPLFADRIRQHFRDFAADHYLTDGSTTTDDSSDSDSATTYSVDSYSGFSDPTTDDESSFYWTASDGDSDFLPELIENRPSP